MNSVGIRAWSARSALGDATALLGNPSRPGLELVSSLPSGIGRLPSPACVGYVGELPPAPGVAAVGDTRQMRLAWAGLADIEPHIREAARYWGADRVGLLLGTSTGGMQQSELAYAHFSASGRLPEHYSCREGHAFDAAPRQLAARLGLRGPVYVVSTACSSSGKALGAAKRLLNAGACDAVVVGGVDTLCRLTLLGFQSLGVLAAAPARPFDAASEGMNVAEGAAWLLLDRRPGGLQLRGVGESSDAYHMVTPHPEGHGALLAMQAALRDAGVRPHELDYINAHGTGTRANDDAEHRALHSLVPGVPRSSSKALHGHLLGASGAMEAIVCAELIRRRTTAVPGSPTSDLSRPARVAMSNSLAFGGSNVSLIISSESPPPNSSHDVRRPTSRARFDVFVERVAVYAETPDLDGQPLLSSRQRGRAALLTRMFEDVLGRLGERDVLTITPLICTSAFGPVETTMDLLEQQQRLECSPLKFQGSVHNAPLGNLTLALQHRGFSTALAAGDDSLWVGLLEACCFLKCHPTTPRVILLAGDEHPPKPLLDAAYGPTAVGFVVSREAGRATAHLRFEQRPSSEPGSDGSSAALLSSTRPSLRAGATSAWASVPEALLSNPCGAAVQLARSIAERRWGTHDVRAGGDSLWSLRLSPAAKTSSSSAR